MKKLLLITLLTVSVPAMATVKPKPKPPQKPPVTQNQNTNLSFSGAVAGSKSKSNATSQSQSSANNSISEGAIQSDVTVNNGGLDLSINDAGNRIVNRYENINRVQHISPNSASNCIGEVCRATNSVVITGQYDEVTGSSINVGVVFPFGGGGVVTDRAMGLEADRMQDRNRQERESHQGEMAQICMVLHEQMSITPEGSPELWDRCFAYTPFTNHTHKVSRTRPHVADGNLGHQASPHSENRH